MFPLPLRCRAGLGLAVVLGLASAAPAAQTLSWSGRAGLASDWFLRGVRLSDGGAPLVFASVDAYVGAWGAGVGAMRLRAADGRWTDAFTLHGGVEWRLDAQTALLADLQATRYGAPLDTWNGTQWSIGLSLGDWGSLFWNHQRLRAEVLDADSLDAALHWPLAPRWRATGGLGYAWHALGAPYVYGQAGLEWHPGAARLQLQRVWTHGAGPGLAGPATAPRWLAGASWVF